MSAPDRIWLDEYGGRAVSIYGSTEYIRADLVPQWMPIETAPKDGGHILAYLHDGQIREVWWQRDSLDGSEYWQDDWDCEPQPTHWQPLPTQPPAT